VRWQTALARVPFLAPPFWANKKAGKETVLKISLFVENWPQVYEQMKPKRNLNILLFVGKKIKPCGGQKRKNKLCGAIYPKGADIMTNPLFEIRLKTKEKKGCAND
jgi:hypothetical protein